MDLPAATYLANDIWDSIWQEVGKSCPWNPWESLREAVRSDEPYR